MNHNYSYQFTIPDRPIVKLDFELQLETLEMIHHSNETKPDWTKLEYHQCSHCPLVQSDEPYCPAAVNLIDLVEQFKDIDSIQNVHLEVSTPERTTISDTQIVPALRSLMGLLVATSGCPKTHALKAQARFHLPVSSIEETIVRSASFYILSLYLRDGSVNENPFGELAQMYEELNMTNHALAKRIRSSIESDSAINAIIQLDTFTEMLQDEIDASFDDLKRFFQPLSNIKHH